MICILHGYLLDGSGSNLWTQSIVRSLCRGGETVHLVCQEPHPEKFDFVAEAIHYDEALRPSVILKRKDRAYPGSCILHKPTLGDLLPVYVWDKYEEYDRVVPMVELDDAAIEDYLRRNAAVLERVIAQHGITAVHANHAVLMSVVAQRVCAARAIPYTIMPHGSAIEYAVKKDERLFKLAAEAFAGASRIFVIGPEIRERVNAVFSSITGIGEKLVDLNLGVDTSLFEPVSPDQRRDRIVQLAAALQGVERGKRPEQTRALRHRLSDDISEQALHKALVQSSDYTAKHPDADCETKLARVSWERDKILLFVGRLIASKGVHGVMAALPSILKEQPDLQLVIVGHGPLREPLEAMLWALDTGNRTLFTKIVTWGRSLEGATAPEPLVHVQRYLEHLDAQEVLDAYFESARELRLSERVTFTGYLKHHELRYLFPCCDVAIFPSIVAEAGPLVFLEALASGVFPIGIYFAGMAASIDSVAEIVPEEVVELMKLRKDPTHTIADIVADSLGALALDRRHAADLRRVAVERYDWAAVADKLLTTLQSLTTSR